MKPESKPFRFKQFEIYQDKCAMKIGTDGVLLGAWLTPEKLTNILDIGTGTGLLALMIAQRSNADITAVEVEEQAAEQAQRNFINSPWSNQISLHKGSFQNFTTNTKYDLIVSNPPYFTNKEKATPRNKARNEASLDLATLISKSVQLLSKEGKICLVLPFSKMYELQQLSKSHKLYLNKLCRVCGNSNQPVKRILVALSFRETEADETDLQIELNNRHEYSPEYVAMLKDYLLIF